MKVGLNERNDVDNKQPSSENFSLKVSLGKMFSKSSCIAVRCFNLSTLIQCQSNLS